MRSFRDRICPKDTKRWKVFTNSKRMEKGGILMLVKIEKNNKLALPDRICQELGISKGDRFYASIKEGKIVLRPSNHQNRDADKSRKNGKERIVMFASASEAFDEVDFD